MKFTLLVIFSWYVKSKRLSLYETGSPAHMGTRLARSSDFVIKKANTDCLNSVIPEMLHVSHSDTDTGSLHHYFTHIVKVKFAPTHLLTILTEHACQHNSFWRSRCDSNHAPTISPKLVHFHGDFGIRFWH